MTVNDCPLGAGWEIEFLLPGFPMLDFDLMPKIKTKSSAMNFQPEQKLNDELQLKKHLPSAHLAPSGLVPQKLCYLIKGKSM